jgi:autotransporter-associated beta strand protein
LRYAGSGDSTDRLFRIDGGNGSIVTFDASGTGALNLTNTTNPAAAASNTSATIVLTGTNTDANTFAANYGNNGTGVRNLIKNGSGTWFATGTNGYTGTTTINDGTLFLTGATQATSAITFTGGSLGLDTAVTVTASSAAVDLTNGTITVTGSTGSPSYTLLTAASITGAPTLAAPVPGYELQVIDGATDELRLVETGASSPYDTWSGGAPFGDDANGDGVSNGLAFLLGAASPTSAVTLPTVTQSGGGLVMTFSMLDVASRGTASLSIEHSSDLGISDAWTAVTVPEANEGPTNGVTFTVSENTEDADLNDVVATISSSEAAGGKLFGRLKAVNP